MGKIRVVVVDDSAFMRKVLSDSLAADPDIEVIGEAQDGFEALTRVDELGPDVITLDLLMPKLNGFGALERIMDLSRPPAVLMVSAYTKDDAEVTLNCLTMGAVDFILKPSESAGNELSRMAAELCSKVKMAAHSRGGLAASAGAVKANAPQAAGAHKPYQAVVIGASTGGPVALEELLPGLAQPLRFPVFIAQHLPEQFVVSLAGRLAKKYQLPIEVAANDVQIRPGIIYFAPGGADTEVHREPGGQLEFSVQPSDSILTPSVDKLMVSVAQAYAGNILGVMLTGMGEDGLTGMQAIKSAGGVTVVQDENTSAVYGMGRVVVQHGLADHILPLSQIAGSIHGL